MDLFFFAGLRLDSVTKNNAQTANVVDFSVLFFWNFQVCRGAVVSACGSSGQWQQAMALLYQMEFHRIQGWEGFWDATICGTIAMVSLRPPIPGVMGPQKLMGVILTT